MSEIYLDSVGMAVDSTGLIYPWNRYGNTDAVCIDHKTLLVDEELNCEVYTAMSWGDKEFLLTFVGKDMYETWEANAKNNLG